MTPTKAYKRLARKLDDFENTARECMTSWIENETIVDLKQAYEASREATEVRELMKILRNMHPDVEYKSEF